MSQETTHENLPRILLDLIKGHKKTAVLLFFSLIAGALFESAGLSLLLPLLSNIVNVPGTDSLPVFDTILKQFPEDYKLEAILCLLIATFFLKSALLLTYRGLGTKFAMNLRETWSNKLFSRYMFSAYADIIQQKQGSMVNDIANEPLLAARAIVSLLLLLSKLLLALLLLGLLFITSWKITLVTMTGGLVVFLLLRKTTSNYSKNVGAQRLKINQEISALSTEGLGAVKEVKLFGLQNRYLQQLDKLTARFGSINTRLTVFSDLPGYTIEFIIILLLSVALAAFSMLKGDLESIFPTLSFFVVVAQRMLVYLSNFISLRMRFLSFVPSLLMIHTRIQENVRTHDSFGSKDPGPLKKDIVFNDVHFMYDNQHPVFEGLNMTLKLKHMTAIIGGSGVGKTTIMDLLAGLFTPQKGDILINDIPLREISEYHWRKRIGYVSQDPLVFNASIRENIMAGNPDANEEAMLNAAKMANIHEVILSLPQGYDTPVGDRGAMLSGGQRQRLTIARAIIRNPDLYIFDEATSALDSESEDLVLQAIETLSKNATVLVIAHRVSTLRKADTIFELKKGGGIVQRKYEDIQDGQLELVD